jgi:hypothetical protein
VDDKGEGRSRQTIQDVCLQSIRASIGHN